MKTSKVLYRAISTELTKVYINNGTGTFTDSGQSIGLNKRPITSIPVGDVDGDGDMDLVFTNARGLGIFLNDGIGNSIDTLKYLSSAPKKIIFGDVDGDGDPDLIEANWGGGNRVWINSLSPNIN